MARKVIWAPRAITSLDQAAAYIEQDSPSAAQRLVEAALAAADSLAELSDRGRFVPELSDGVHRELLIGHYRMIYRIRGDRISIVALVHDARDFRSWWNRRRRDRPPN